MSRARRIIAQICEWRLSTTLEISCPKRDYCSAAMATQRLRHKLARDGVPSNANLNESFCVVRVFS